MHNTDFNELIYVLINYFNCLTEEKSISIIMKLPWRFRLVHFLHRLLAVIFNLWLALDFISFLSGRAYPTSIS